MLLVLTTTAALMLWIVLWALGVKAIDGFLLAAVILLVATGVKMVLDYLPSQRDR